jgi:hypothetical protein
LDELLPTGVVTMTLAGPALPAGVRQSIWVELTTDMLGDETPANVTLVAPVKPVPDSVTFCPPASGPVEGVTLVSVGAFE